MTAPAAPSKLSPVSRTVAVLLGLVFACSLGLHAHRAANPTSYYQSEDERAYGGLAIGIADHLRYGSSEGNALHWPPGAPVLFAVGHRLAPGATDAKTSESARPTGSRRSSR